MAAFFRYVFRSSRPLLWAFAGVSILVLGGFIVDTLVLRPMRVEIKLLRYTQQAEIDRSAQLERAMPIMAWHRASWVNPVAANQTSPCIETGVEQLRKGIEPGISHFAQCRQMVAREVQSFGIVQTEPILFAVYAARIVSRFARYGPSVATNVADILSEPSINCTQSAILTAGLLKQRFPQATVEIVDLSSPIFGGQSMVRFQHQGLEMLVDGLTAMVMLVSLELLGTDRQPAFFQMVDLFDRKDATLLTFQRNFLRALRLGQVGVENIQSRRVIATAL